LRRAFEAANGIGDVVYAPAPRPLSAQNMLTAGDHLGELRRVAQVETA